MPSVSSGAEPGQHVGTVGVGGADGLVDVGAIRPAVGVDEQRRHPVIGDRLEGVHLAIDGEVLLAELFGEPVRVGAPVLRPGSRSAAEMAAASSRRRVSGSWRPPACAARTVTFGSGDPLGDEVDGSTISRQHDDMCPVLRDQSADLLRDRPTRCAPRSPRCAVGCAPDRSHRRPTCGCPPRPRRQRAAPRGGRDRRPRGRRRRGRRLP